MKITIEVTVSADLNKVWKYYLEPEHIVKWNFASDDWCCSYAENDLRVGGQYKARMEAKDGSFGFDFEAIYDEVSALERIKYTMPDGRVVVTNFEDDGGKTKVKTTFDAEKQNPVDMQRDGWHAILNNFKAYTESN